MQKEGKELSKTVIILKGNGLKKVLALTGM
jgi:hypothetical protein